ncbi:M20/M25/M40 family metallo-hydrolase [Halomicrobium mukohataei]|uniref:M20/M25/M40 family metallo-hydrolase n=1 Tax=Halomicrobium mukohataei TaxID=57705 RepID=A0A847UIQ3_9EURY|nr:M20 family metallopeptidase [Halomicrobium mukohataei]NLV11464.1 M20/M25/M40 family metallo-hydrolase [Halomicrobium mukohataei]
MADAPTFDVDAFHREAVETPSHDSVDEMRDLLVDTLAADGHEATVDEAGNVLASREADDEGPHLVLNTHIDTVPPHVPYEAADGSSTAGDVVRGRGACDAKGPLAALLAAFLRAELSTGRLTLAVTPDEETHQTGAGHLEETLSADGYVVGEPTALDVCTAARGQFEGRVTIHGESAHASDPADGANAIRAAAPIMQAMESYDEREALSAAESDGEHTEPRDAAATPAHETLGRPTLTPSMIEGGEAPNQVPAECTITFDRRSVPPETSDEFPERLEAHLRQWLPDGMSLDVSLVRPDTPFPEAFETDREATLVQTLAAESDGAIRPFGAATEAAHFAPDAPTVVFGPGVLADEEGAVAHSDREYVRRSEIHEAARAVEATVERLL